MDVPVAPSIVIESPAPCSDVARAKELLQRTLGPALAPRSSWTVIARFSRKGSSLVVEGEITFTIGEKRLVATAGMFANMPVGTPHAFKNESGNPARMLIFVAPAGLEKMFLEVGVPVAQGTTTCAPPTKEEIAKLMAIAPRYGIQIQLPGH